MAKHIRIKTLENNYVHFDGKSDYTLCGLDTIGDTSLSIEESVETTKKVDCPTCIEIVNYCQKIKQTELRK